MLILLPASDTKAAVPAGPPLDLAGLSFPTLGPTRAAVLDALIDVSGRPDATRRLGDRPTMAATVLANTALRDAPTTTVDAVYAGVLYDALAASDLDAAARRRARSWIVVVSALWGAVRLGDRIPSYRLDMCGRLPGLPLPDVWRAPLDDVLPGAAGRGLVVDGRSSEYATAWRPTGALAARTVVLRVARDLDGRRGAAGHPAKRTRGLVVRRIVTDAITARSPQDLAAALADHFTVDLTAPARDGRAYELTVVAV